MMTYLFLRRMYSALGKKLYFVMTFQFYCNCDWKEDVFFPSLLENEGIIIMIKKEFICRGKVSPPPSNPPQPATQTAGTAGGWRPRQQNPEAVMSKNINLPQLSPAAVCARGGRDAEVKNCAASSVVPRPARTRFSTPATEAELFCYSWTGVCWYSYSAGGGGGKGGGAPQHKLGRRD